MRAKDFLIVEAQQELFEVNMSPSNLKKLASEIPAIVGIEFEMIVPNIGSLDDPDSFEPEEDMYMDEGAYDIDSIVDFFGNNYNNSRSDLRALASELREGFTEWQDAAIRKEWNSEEGKKFFAKWCRENVDPDDVADHVDKEEDLFGDRIPDKDDWEKFIEDEWDNEDSNYDNAFDEFKDEKVDEGDFDEAEFLDSIGIHQMSHVVNNVDTDITWPYWTEYEGGYDDGESDLSELADEFSKMIGRPTNYSTSYHGGDRTEGEYDIEPDSSLSGSGTGLEFISPPLPLDEALEDIKKVKKWASEIGADTNRSTGLHMNISVPGFDPSKLDFVKLTLLLGDKYILERFGRSANTYCKSALDVIQQAPSDKDKELLFKKLKDNLETMASKVIHSGRVGKFTSINPKDNRVEFRGPGGDWLGDNYANVEDTLYRCVVALDAAVDPTKYRKEYLKKLTKMFAPTKGSIEDVFVQYAAGAITRQELKDKLKATQSKRKQDKYTAQGIVEVDRLIDARMGDWIVEYDNPNRFEVKRVILKRTEQINTDGKALEAAMKLEPSWFKPDEIENITVTECPESMELFVISNEDKTVDEQAWGYTPLQALATVIKNLPSLAQQRDSLTVSPFKPDTSPEQPETPRMAPGEEMYLVRNNDTGHEVRIAAVTDAQAVMRAARNDPHNFPGGVNNDNITATLLRRQPPETTGQEDMMYLVRRGSDARYIAARSPGEASRIAITLYGPLLGTSTDQLEITPDTSYGPEVVSLYRRNQESELNQLNNRQPTAAPANPNQGMDAYLVNDPDPNVGGGVRIRANSPEHAIERARQIYNLGPDRELVARLDSQ